MAYTLDGDQLDLIQDILEKDLVDLGIHCVLLIDVSGNIIASYDNGNFKHDIYSLAALAAANFGAVSSMATMIGENEFSILFHKGENENIHFSKVADDFLLINIFGKEVSLGFLRMKATESIEKIEKILG
jgi:predicted regulator of Ras-like GTPase activity (Roadblock/LC7/MglB family)